MCHAKYSHTLSMITVYCNHQTHKSTTGSMRCSPMETRLLRNSEAIALFLPQRIATIHTLEYLNTESDCEACTTLLQTRNHPQHPSPRSTLVLELMPAGNEKLLNLDGSARSSRKSAQSTRGHFIIIRNLVAKYSAEKRLAVAQEAFTSFTNICHVVNSAFI